MRKSLLFLTFLAVFTCAQARYTIITDTIFGSAFYPGTVHTMQVSIPDVADTSKPVMPSTAVLPNFSLQKYCRASTACCARTDAA